MAEANRITCERLGVLPPSLRKTLTRDRGGENMGYAILEKELNIRCFFALSSYDVSKNGYARALRPRHAPFLY